MVSSLSFNHRFHPDMQIGYSYKGLGSTRRGFCGKNMELNLSFNKFQKPESKPRDKCNMHPKRVSQAIQAHYSEGFCSEILVRDSTIAHSLGLLKEETLFRRGFIRRMDGMAPVYLDQPKPKSHSGLFDPVSHGSGLICDMENLAIKHDSLQPPGACRTHVAVNTRIAADFGQMNHMSDKSLFNISQSPPAPYGWLSLGVCGNALIMRVGSNARCFHQQGLACGELEFVERMRSCDMLYAPSDAKTHGRSLTKIGGSSSKGMAREPVSLLQGTTIKTKNCVDKLRGKNKQKKIGKTATLTRDLFERSSFHLFEFLFCYPFMDPSAVASNCQLPSRESLRELVGVVNQAAVGLAGVGVTLLLFVASRMLCINAALDKHRIGSLAMGVGFLSLSFAVKRVSDVVTCMADAYSRSRAFKKEFIIRFQKELQYVAFHALPLIVMCFMGAG